MARSRQLAEVQRVELLQDLDSSLRIADFPLIRYSVLKKCANLMGQLGLDERGEWTRAVLSEAVRYAGRNFFKRSLKLQATNSTSWSGVGFDRLPHGPSLAEVIFTLQSLDDSRLLQATVTCSLSGSGVTAQGFVGEVEELRHPSFSVQNGGRRTNSWKRNSDWSKAVIAAFRQGDTASVWATLDRAWGEIFSRPAAFVRKPLSAVAIQARCQLLKGSSVQVTTASGEVVAGVCNGQTPQAVRILLAGLEAEVPLNEIFDFHPYRIVG